MLLLTVLIICTEKDVISKSNQRRLRLDCSCITDVNLCICFYIIKIKHYMCQSSWPVFKFEKPCSKA